MSVYFWTSSGSYCSFINLSACLFHIVWNILICFGSVSYSIQLVCAVLSLPCWRYPFLSKGTSFKSSINLNSLHAVLSSLHPLPRQYLRSCMLVLPSDHTPGTVFPLVVVFQSTEVFGFCLIIAEPSIYLGLQGTRIWRRCTSSRTWGSMTRRTAGNTWRSAVPSYLGEMGCAHKQPLVPCG